MLWAGDDRVDQCILELHQDELVGLGRGPLEALMELSLAGRCLNPLWTIFLVHNKAMLGVLRRLASDSGGNGGGNGVGSMSPDTCAVLRKHVIPTSNGGVRDQDLMFFFFFFFCCDYCWGRSNAGAESGGKQMFSAGYVTRPTPTPPFFFCPPLPFH